MNTQEVRQLAGYQRLWVCTHVDISSFVHCTKEKQGENINPMVTHFERGAPSTMGSPYEVFLWPEFVTA